MLVQVKTLEKIHKVHKWRVVRATKFPNKEYYRYLIRLLAQTSVGSRSTETKCQLR